MIKEKVEKKEDEVWKCNRIKMIVSKIDNGGVLNDMVKNGDIKNCRKKKRRIEIGKGIIEKEKIRIKKNGEEDGEEMEMKEGKMERKEIKIRSKMKNLGGGMNEELN